MLPPSVEEILETIDADHTSGATRIAGMGLNALESLVRDSPSPLSSDLVREAARRIPEAQRTNAALYNVTQIFARLVAEGQNPEAVLQQLRHELDSAREAVARNFLKIAPDDATVVTLTFSANVLTTLQRAHEKGKIDRVYVMESRPLNEGRFLLIALTESGVRTTLVPDALGPGLMAHATYALVGADTVLRDGSFVNKTGTYALALAATDHRKPLYVACETMKFDARYDSTSWPGAPIMNPSEIWESPPERIDVLNRYFELTPARLVTMVATERGSYAPDTVRTMLAQAKGQK